MANYDTKALTVGDITVTVSKAGKTGGERVKALLELIADHIVDPGYGVGAGNRPDQGLPPSGARPDQGLPPAPARPGQGLPPAPGTKPIDPDAPEAGQLPSHVAALAELLKTKAREIAAGVLKDTACDPAKPK
jgi:hypothetical protein